MENTVKDDERGSTTPTTQRVSGRCIRKPRKDDETSSPKVCPRRLGTDIAISSPKSTNPEKTRRSWDLWTHECKNWFFEALCEFGKDFDAIYNSMAAKSRKNKSLGDMTFKNKDQVRSFYYRTWNKVSKALGDLGEMKKSVQEIYGLVNYSEMRKKIGSKASNRSNAPRLLELVTTGQTMIKVKGKNLRIKTPVCRALRIINNVPDKYNEGPKIPAQITLEFRPFDNGAWTHVQSLANNPRVRIQCHPQRKLSSIIELLEERWQPTHLKKKSSLLAALEGIETPQELKISLFQFASPQRLQMKVFPNSTLQSVDISLADTYCSSDVCLNAYLARFTEETCTKQPCCGNPKPSESVSKPPDPPSLKLSVDSGPRLSVDSRVPPDPVEVPVPNLPSFTSEICDTKKDTPSSSKIEAGPKIDFRTTFTDGFGCRRTADEAVCNLIEPSVAALASEEANDGLQLQTTSTGETSEKPEPGESPVGDGWTLESFGIMTVGDLFLRVGCPESLILFYQFFGGDFPPPELRTKAVLDKLITVLSASSCEKKTTPAQTKGHAQPAAGQGPAAVVPQRPNKRDRLSEKATRESSQFSLSEFAVPQGTAPKVLKREVTLDSIKIDLPAGNRRHRIRRKPISAMMVQRPVLPRLEPSNGAAAPQSVPNGVVVRSIMPTLEHQPMPSVDLSVNSVSLESFMSTVIEQKVPETLPEIQDEVKLAIDSQTASDRLQTPQKVFSGEEDQNASLPVLDFSPLLPSTPTKWLNGEASMSLGSLFNSLESPLKGQPCQPDSNSNLESKLSDVESHLQSLMNESSLEYMSKFADLAAQIARQPTPGTSGDV